MDHEHSYDSQIRLALSAGARNSGIEEAETRKCSACGRETVFIKAQGQWVPLTEETERSEQDILLA